jgi:hypothetical protein
MRKRLAAFLVASALLGLLVLRIDVAGAATVASQIAVALLVGGLTAFWLLAFKAGFVRQDTHTIIAWETVGIAATLYAFSRRAPCLTVSPAVPAIVLATGVIMIALVAPQRWAAFLPGPTVPRIGELYYRTFVQYPVRHWIELAGNLSDPSRWQVKADAAKASAWRRIREARPLPRLAGGVDIIPPPTTHDSST